MFIWKHADEAWITLQTDHMAQVGDFAARWGNDRVAPPRHVRPAVTAARNHDEGWRTWEMSPEIDPETGLPFDFIKVSRLEHIKFYGRGVEFLRGHDLHAALLVSRHATGLHLGRYGVDGEVIPERDTLRPEIRQFVEDQEAGQEKMLAELGLSEDEMIYDYRLLQAWDRLSICFCHGRAESTLGPVPLRDDNAGEAISAKRLDDTTVALSPFPFEGDEQMFPVRMFELKEGPFTAAEGFVAALASQPAVWKVYKAVAG